MIPRTPSCARTAEALALAVLLAGATSGCATLQNVYDGVAQREQAEERRRALYPASPASR